MAERFEQQADAPLSEATHEGDSAADLTQAAHPAPDGAVVEHPDGSSARASTQDGHLDHDDVENSPFVQGTDPLSDDAIDHRRGGASVTPQLVIFGLLALLFVYFFVSDIVNGEWLKALLGAVVLAICGFAIAREVREKR